MNYTEIEILEKVKKVKKLLWDGKGKPVEFKATGGTSEFICHILEHILQSEMDYKYNDVFFNVKDAVVGHCDGDSFIAYETALIKFGVISVCASSEEIQNHRFMLVDQIIHAYKEGVSWAIPSVK